MRFGDRISSFLSKEGKGIKEAWTNNPEAIIGAGIGAAATMGDGGMNPITGAFFGAMGGMGYRNFKGAKGSSAGGGQNSAGGGAVVPSNGPVGGSGGGGVKLDLNGVLGPGSDFSKSVNKIVNEEATAMHMNLKAGAKNQNSSFWDNKISGKGMHFEGGLGTNKANFTRATVTNRGGASVTGYAPIGNSRSLGSSTMNTNKHVALPAPAVKPLSKRAQLMQEANRQEPGSDSFNDLVLDENGNTRRR